jgi:hypothetical protein
MWIMLEINSSSKNSEHRRQETSQELGDAYLLNGVKREKDLCEE